MAWYFWWSLYRFGDAVGTASYAVQQWGVRVRLFAWKRARTYPQWWADEEEEAVCEN